MTFVRVLHGAVGPYQQGAVLNTDRFDPAELERLEAAGAVQAVGDDAVDANSLTLDETVRYPSQWTLPNVPHTDVDADTLRAKMGVSRAEAAVTTARTVQAADARRATSRGEVPPPEPFTDEGAREESVPPEEIEPATTEASMAAANGEPMADEEPAETTATT